MQPHINGTSGPAAHREGNTWRIENRATPRITSDRTSLCLKTDTPEVRTGVIGYIVIADISHPSFLVLTERRRGTPLFP